MSTNREGARATRRQSLIGIAALTASASAASPPDGPMIKRASLLARKPGMTHEEFVKHWVEVHAPLARACPGISRYTLTIIKTSSTRKDVAPIDVQVDGIAELWFKNQADFDAYQSSPATKRLRDDGATFIGREIDFVADEKIIIS